MVMPTPTPERATLRPVYLTDSEMAYIQRLLDDQADTDAALLQAAREIPAERRGDTVERFALRLSKIRAIQTAFRSAR